ncbi:hypothetical protein AB0Y21_00235 [Weissella paramesenteroides]|uniref:hypothetical protein n=1 Tax=Weissella paramesenteroides TaxID=1249 RepID=UPI003F21C83C
MTKYVIDLPDNVSFIVGKGYVLFNEKEFLRIPVKQLEKYSKKEDVFEVEKPKKWVVRSKDTDSEGSHLYVKLYTSSTSSTSIPDITTYFGSNNATRFDTKEEAESWANSHQEVIEVEE